MTPAQQALKAYIIAKMGEGVFEKLKTPATIMKKAGAEFAADLPVVLSDLLSMMGESAVNVVGKVVLDKIGAVARDVSKRGVANVFTEIRDSIDMQYQRGVERQRRKS